MATKWDNLSDPIFHHAAAQPDARALIDGPVVLTYRELADLVGRASVYLDAIGIRAGDRVGVCLSSGIDHVVLVMALSRVGATFADLQFSSTAPIPAEVVTRLGLGRLFLEANSAAPSIGEIIRVDSGWRGRLSRHAGDRRAEATAETLQVLTSSSGTTGSPKSLLKTHRLILDRQTSYEESMGPAALSAEQPANMILTASIALSPFFRRLLGQFIAGGPVILLPEYAHPIDLVKAICPWDNVVFGATANMCRAFIAAAPLDGVLFPGVRALVSLGTPLYPEEKRAMVRRVTPNFYDSYGASGIGGITCLLPAEVEAMAASVGRAAPGVAIEIVDTHGAPCAAGTIGRVRCRGVNSAESFLTTNEPASIERFAEGWYYPGEFGYLDENGFLFLKGRISDAVRRSGVELFPTDVEEALASHPGVREVAVVGVPSNLHGEDLVAVVVKNGSPNHDEIAQHCRARLSPEKWPDRIFYAASLPATLGGKPDRMKVRAIVLEEIARRQKPAAR